MGADLPLSDVKVLDLMWAMAGPGATRVLADHGATVVRIESSRKIEVGRALAPYHGGQPGLETSGFFQNMNAGKFGITLDLTSPMGREVFLDLVRWADVVSESFSPRVMQAWGLDYRALQAVKPDLIMVSTCLMGQTGPFASLAGYGNMGAALAGFYELTGWPDRAPCGPYGAYTDYVAPRFTALAVLAALEYRRRTGQGQYIDQSQVECSLHFLTPALLDYTVNGRVPGRAGNRDPAMAPHGVYPTSGDDRWLAVAVADDQQWRALCGLMGKPELADDPRFCSLEERLAYHDELDAIVAAWSERRDPYQLERLLQASGIPASVVQNGRDVYADPQLAYRGHFVALEHPIHGTTVVEGPRFTLSRTPARVRRAAPILGQDTQYVLETILGYDAQRIAELAAAGVLE